MNDIFNFAQQQMNNYSARFGNVNPMQQDLTWGCQSLCIGQCSGGCSMGCQGACLHSCYNGCKSSCTIVSGKRY